MSLKVHINGELVDKEDARISVFDHGLLYGDGVFEGMRSYAGKVFRLEEHLERLWQSANAIQLEIPGNKQQMAAAVMETLVTNDIQDGYIRLVVTRGVGTLGLDPVTLEGMVVEAGFSRFLQHQVDDPTNLYYEVRP